MAFEVDENSLGVEYASSECPFFRMTRPLENYSFTGNLVMADYSNSQNLLAQAKHFRMHFPLPYSIDVDKINFHNSWSFERSSFVRLLLLVLVILSGVTLYPETKSSYSYHDGQCWYYPNLQVQTHLSASSFEFSSVSKLGLLLFFLGVRQHAETLLQNHSCRNERLVVLVLEEPLSLRLSDVAAFVFLYVFPAKARGCADEVRMIQLPAPSLMRSSRGARIERVGRGRRGRWWSIMKRRRRRRRILVWGGSTRTTAPRLQIFLASNSKSMNWC